MDINVNSEIGRLQGVILHKPGIEIERMTPENAHHALYSDILNMNTADREYAQFEGVLSKVTKTFTVTELIISALQDENTRRTLIDFVCKNEGVLQLQPILSEMSVETLAHTLIEGYENKGDFSDNRYVLRPLYNLFFTRDASSSVRDKVLINTMANQVRDRESYLMKTIFDNKKQFNTQTIRLKGSAAEGVNVEGGDVLIAREDVLLIGTGLRTSAKAIEQLVALAKQDMMPRNIVVQELPKSPDSFIHLDMVFTFLDKNACMCFEPIICKPSNYKTTHIAVDGNNVTYHQRETMLDALQQLHFDLKPITCGKADDVWIQQREQWHSGANFFAFAPGKIIGYARNTYTIEQLNNNGFDVLKAQDIVEGREHPDNHTRCVVTIDGTELPRGGGGARCMTMPVSREKVNW